MRGALSTEFIEKYASNERVTISLRKDDLLAVSSLVSYEADAVGGGNVLDDPADEQEQLAHYERILEVIDVALRTQ
jgi:hypothetical protein